MLVKITSVCDPIPRVDDINKKRLNINMPG
jgi:hypothetical protein